MAAETVGESVPRPASPSSRTEHIEAAGRTDGRGPQQVELGAFSRPAHCELRQYESGERTPMRLSIIMAAFNEERTIIKAVEGVLQNDYPCDIELLVIDDGSTDDTGKLLAAVTDPRVVVYRHETNKGKGAALLSASALATGSYILPFDADLEYVAEDVNRLIDPVLKGRCSVVYGVRLFGYNTCYRSYRYAIGNKTLTRMANILYDACLSDLHTCLKLIPTPMFGSLVLRESGFGLDTEITASLLRRGVRPFEVPVSYFGRSHAEGKKISWRDAAKCVWILFRVRFRPQPQRQALVTTDAQTACGVVIDRAAGAGAQTRASRDTGEYFDAVAG